MRAPPDAASSRWVLAIVVGGLVLRLALAAAFGLGVDESYAVAIGRSVSASYFDHPPLVFWIAGGVARLTGSEAPLVVRLPFILLFAGTTWLMYRVTARLLGERAGLWAAALLNLSLVFSVTSGGWVLPDGPLMFCMVAAAWCVTHVVTGDTGGDASDWAWWVGAGAFTGLAMLAKYHGVFVLAGTFAFLLTSPARRRWLARPQPWVAALLAFLVFSPVLFWNEAHGWISFRFQAARGVPVPGIHLRSLLTNVGGQAVYVLPWIWLPLVWMLALALRAGPRDERRWLLCCLAGGPIAAFTLASLGGAPGLPHWEAPGYLFLFPLLGAGVASALERGSRGARIWLAGSAAAFALFVALAGTHLATGWAFRAAPRLFGRRDPGQDMLTWAEAGPALRARGLWGPRTFFAATDWIDAGKLAYALGPGAPVLCLCDEPHHFPFIRSQRARLGEDAVVVHSGAPVDVKALYAPYFASVDSVGTVPIRRGGRVAMELTVYVARHFERPFPFRGAMEQEQ